ncbi:uncharacterized protein LOC103493406 [Cucumis melo]|uniref:Uncharacterized protein LOC103493406 n=1 Tax=Cucumis melo TaxID=3656 RepID=A0A1S3BTN8_CUCME|nr:uncharacterized protein LOC103493406 [Cucumis melo]
MSRVIQSFTQLMTNSKVNLNVMKFSKCKKVKCALKNGKVEEVENKETKIDASLEELDKDAKSTTIVIEHYKQCQSFKKRAIHVKTSLKNGVLWINVLLNPDKPRRVA